MKQPKTCVVNVSYLAIQLDKTGYENKGYLDCIAYCWLSVNPTDF